MKVVVTGAAGDFAQAILPLLFEDPQIKEIVAVDLREPRLQNTKMRFEREDVRSPRMVEIFDSAKVVVHLAFIVAEIRDKGLTHSVNLEGSKSVINCAAKAGVERLVYASSVSAYGAHEDLPRPATEDVFPRGNSDKYYFYDKAEVEHYIEWWERQNPDSPMKIVRLRPTTVVGPAIDNALIELMTSPFAVYPARSASIQFLHQSDLATAFHAAIKSDVRGPFNLAGDGSIEMREMSAVHGQRLLNVPNRVGEVVADIGFKLGLSPISSQWVVYGDPIVSSERAKKELGWQPAFTTIECHYINLAQRGRPLLNGPSVNRRVADVMSRKEVAEAALEPTTKQIGKWIEEIPGLRRAAGAPEEMGRWVERLEHAYIPYKEDDVHLEVHKASDDAPTVVFNAGMGAYARFYLPLLAKLCDEGINVVAIDRPGHGLSSGRRGVASWETILDTAEESIRYARERFSGPVVLAGSSLGGIITWFALTREPDIDAAICHNIAHPQVYHEQAMKLKVPLLTQLARIAPKMGIPVKQIANFDVASREPVLIEALRSEEDRIYAWTICARAVADLFSYRPPTGWPEVEIPTLVLVGEEDEMVTPHFTEQILERARPKNCEMRLLPGLGHMIFHDNLDQTLPIFVDTVRNVTPRSVTA